jgi:hypothetical protein
MDFTENTPDFGNISPHFTLPSDWRRLVQSFQLSDGVFAYPGCGNDLGFLAAEPRLPHKFFNPDDPDGGGLLAVACDYSPVFSEYPTCCFEDPDPDPFQVPKEYSHLFRTARMTVRVRPDSVRQLGVLVPRGRDEPGTYMPMRIVDIEVKQEGREDRCVRVLFSPVPAELFFEFLGATKAPVVIVALLRQGGFSAPLTPNRTGLYDLVPGYVAHYLTKPPEAWLGDDQCNAPPHPDWADIRIRSWGWGEARYKAVSRYDPGYGVVDPGGSWPQARRPRGTRRPSPARTALAALDQPDCGVAPTALEDLLAGLPALAEAEGVKPWHAMQLERWGLKSARTRLERAAVRFLLMAAECPAPLLGPFEPIGDTLAMDEVHRKALEAWFLGKSMSLMNGLGLPL